MAQPKGLIAWFAYNNVAANLLMWVLVIGGIFSAFLINRAMMPTVEQHIIHVSVAYPGAAPQEIEEGIVIKVEEAIKDIIGIKKVSSTSGDGVGNVRIEVDSGYEAQDILDEIKLQIDSISTFPANIEKPNIYRIKPQSNVIWVSVFGEMTPIEMKQLAKEVKDDLTKLPEITRVLVRGTPNNEVSIELSENKLREYGLTFTQVAQAVQNSSVDLPGGSIRAIDGNILLRTKGQAYKVSEFEKLVVATRKDGSRLLLSHVANIKDDFEEGLHYTRFNAKPAVIIEVSSVDDQNALTIAKQVKKYVANKQLQLPDNVNVDYWGDLTYYLDGRIDMMFSNMIYGAILVFILLALFLEVKLAFWVMLGIPICFLGTLLIMPAEPFDQTLNMITLFGFLLVLGIVVDDAIVIGESVYHEIEHKGHSINNVIVGAQKVAMPATFGVLTTMAAFIPMLLTPGPFGFIPKAIATIILLCLAFSLIESKWILPAHLAHMKLKPKTQPKNTFSRFKVKLNQALQGLIANKYRPFIEKCVQWRYSVFMVFVTVLMLTIGLVQNGIVRWVFFPNVPSDFISVSLEMERDTSEAQTLQVVQQIEDALYRVDDKMAEKYGQPILANSQIDVGTRTSAFIFAELTKNENREVNASVIAKAWREELPELAAVKKLSLDGSTSASGGSDIAFRIVSSNIQQLEQATKELKQKLESYQGVHEISDNLSSGGQEIRLTIRPEAEALGLNLSELARQVRYAFYGFEAQRILRNREEVKVMVRYPVERRRTVGHLEQMMIRTPNGVAVPFSSVANIEKADSYASISRIDGSRAITVMANVDKDIIEPKKIVDEIQNEFIPLLTTKYSQISTKLDGASQDEAEAMLVMLQGAFFALFTIYALMAIPLKSYTQPLVIMAVIPFGIIGAVLGHLLYGIPLNILSMYGILALSGVVVNDSLVLVDYINKARAQGLSIKQTAIEAGCRRFRAILLTTMTTFVGLAPILLEKSLQAQILIPMAISLAFGILFATAVTLVLVPVLYVILEDVKAQMNRFYQWWWQPQN
ncbi:MAG: efflux RND transporter permease subunit [Parashewanella sp.]